MDWPAPSAPRLPSLTSPAAGESEIVEGAFRAPRSTLCRSARRRQCHVQAQRLVLEESTRRIWLAGQLAKTRRREPATRARSAVTERERKLMSAFWHDLKVAPASSCQSVLGHGAGMLPSARPSNRAIFSVFDALILRPLPFAEPSQASSISTRPAAKWNSLCRRLAPRFL